MRRSNRLANRKKTIPKIVPFTIKLPVRLSKGFGCMRVSALAIQEIKARISGSDTRFLIESFSVRINESIGKYGRVGRINALFSSDYLLKETILMTSQEYILPATLEVDCIDLFKGCPEINEESTHQDNPDDVYFIYNLVSSPNNTVSATFTVKGNFIEENMTLESRMKKIQKAIRPRTSTRRGSQMTSSSKKTKKAKNRTQSRLSRFFTAFPRLISYLKSLFN